jgi:hypothetical protein
MPSVPPEFAHNAFTQRKARVGDRTMIVKRGGIPTRDWIFVGLLVCALGVTASMLFSYRGQQEQVAEDEEGETTEQQAITAHEPTAAVPASAASIATQLMSTPSGAEVVVGGAVVGNTPVRVARTDVDTDYTVRLAGYEPQVVRVNAVSPPTVLVALKPH